MKSNTTWKLGTLVLAGVAAYAFATGQTPAAQAGGPEGPCGNQPHMAKAIAALETAAAELKDAEHDKGGWRVAAIKHTEQAIAETRRGCKFDNKH